MQCTISGDALECALLAAPKDDVRYYLNGVWVEWNETKTRVVVTNGHYMYVNEHEPQYSPNEGSCGFIIPREVLAKVKPTANTSKRSNAYIVTAEKRSTQEGVELFDCTIRECGENTVTSFSNTVGKFPDYKRVVPHFPVWDLTYYHSASDDNTKVYYAPEVYGQPRISVDPVLAEHMVNTFEKRETIAYYDFDYLTMAMKMQRIHKGKKDAKTPRLYQNGDKPGLIEFSGVAKGEAFLVIMPVREDNVNPPVLVNWETDLYVPEKESPKNDEVQEG